MPKLYTEQERFQLNSEVQTGSRIGVLINDEVVQKHLNGLLHGYQNTWLEESDSTEREKIWLKAYALKTFVESLQSVINSGLLAAQQLAQERE